MSGEEAHRHVQREVERNTAKKRAFNKQLFITDTVYTYSSKNYVNRERFEQAKSDLCQNVVENRHSLHHRVRSIHSAIESHLILAK